MLLLLFGASAHAAPWTAEDLVRADQRGLPLSTTTGMAADVAHEPETAVYLLRRGVSESRVGAWGFAVSVDTRAHAAALGPLGAPPPRVEVAEWLRMGELPVCIQRADGAIVGGEALVVLPDRMVLDTFPRLVVERADAARVWVDERPLDREVVDGAAGEEPGPRAGRVHLARSNAGIVTGALLGMAGGVTFAYGASMIGHQTTPLLDEPPVAPHRAPDLGPEMLVLGSVGLIGAGVSFELGAHERVLAGAYPLGWRPPTKSRAW